MSGSDQLGSIRPHDTVTSYPIDMRSSLLSRAILSAVYETSVESRGRQARHSGPCSAINSHKALPLFFRRMGGTTALTRDCPCPGNTTLTRAKKKISVTQFWLELTHYF